MVEEEEKESNMCRCTTSIQSDGTGPRAVKEEEKEEANVYRCAMSKQSNSSIPGLTNVALTAEAEDPPRLVERHALGNPQHVDVKRRAPGVRAWNRAEHFGG